jgi:nitronate monooxygenase
MAGSCPPGLAAAVANAGGLGGMGALMTSPEGIAEWVAEFRSQSNGPFLLNRWIPQPTPARNPAAEIRMRDFLSKWGPPVPAEVGDVRFPDFEQQCEAFLDAEPLVVSSIMGLFPAGFMRRLKDRGIPWFACVTTLAEALEAERAGADAVVAQGHEAGGHRGSFDQASAECQGIGPKAD